MVARKSRTTFVDRHDLWTDEQRRAAVEVERAIKSHKLELVRFAFADQHGTLRGKTLVAETAPAGMRNGVAMTSTLLAKDTAHRNVFAVFSEGGGMNVPEMTGAGNFIMVADPTTFRVLPWTNATGWILCDTFFPNGRPVPVCTRRLFASALERLAAAGFDYQAGLEVEFHLFRLEDPRLAPEDVTWPPPPPRVSLTTQGFQYLTESRFDQVDPILETLRRALQALSLPLRSLEVELGPSQYEFTFAPQTGLAAADAMTLFRSAMKQVARRHGHLVSFMCRPRIPNVFSTGWHLHQSLIDRKTRGNAFVSRDETQLLSPVGRHFLAGVLTHARAASPFATPTTNGYKRFHVANSMAPIQAIWAHDNRGVMIRALGAPHDPTTHLENRVGEPLANPYLYMSSQIHAGFDGMTRKLEPPPSADTPYELRAEPLPRSLAEAIDALDASTAMRGGFGDVFVDYILTIKRAELARAAQHPDGDDEPGGTSAWEHQEYFDAA